MSVARDPPYEVLTLAEAVAWIAQDQERMRNEVDKRRVEQAEAALVLFIARVNEETLH